MRVDGRWHRFQDGALRPVIDAAVFSPSGVWQTITMLLDCGADRTVFDASLLSLLTPLASSQNLELAGVGGKADSKVIEPAWHSFVTTEIELRSKVGSASSPI
jgi:hypothetical protein